MKMSPLECLRALIQVRCCCHRSGVSHQVQRRMVTAQPRENLLVPSSALSMELAHRGSAGTEQAWNIPPFCRKMHMVMLFCRDN